MLRYVWSWKESAIVGVLYLAKEALILGHRWTMRHSSNISSLRIPVLGKSWLTHYILFLPLSTVLQDTKHSYLWALGSLQEQVGKKDNFRDGSVQVWDLVQW